MFDPTPDLPVFRLVPDTTDFSPWLRFLLAFEAGLVEDFEPGLPLPWSEN